MRVSEAKLQGWIDLKLVDRSGKVVFEHQQSNLILDKGLEYVAQTQNLAGMHFYFAVGTGSTAPSPSQTALVSEIARTLDTLGYGPDMEVIVNGNGDYTIRRTRVFDYNEANGNLTEFGGSDGNSAADGVNTRELFRDANGTPIVITKTNNERLVIVYSVRIIITPVTATDFGILEFKDNEGNTVATRLVRHTFGNRLNATFIQGVDVSIFGGIIRDGSDWATSFPNIRITFPDSPIDLNYAADEPYTVIYDMLTTNTYVGISNGVASFDASAELQPEADDRTIYGCVLGVEYGRSYLAAFVNPDGTPNPFVKNKDYRFGITFRFSVSRGS